MSNNIARILMVLFTAGGIVYAVYAFAVKKAYRDRKMAAFHGLYSLILVLQGSAFLFYFPFNRFSFLANMVPVFFTYSGFILAYHFKTEKQDRIVLASLTSILIFLTIWKLIAFTEMTFINRLPLNICNILIIFVVLRYFRRSRVLDNYILCFGIIAGIVNYLVGAFYNDTSPIDTLGRGFFYYRMIEAALLHNVFLLYSVYTFLRKIIIVNRRDAMLNMAWITPLFAVFIFCNQVWKTDFFFTGIYGITPRFLIDIYYFFPLRFQFEAGGFVFEINILHALLLIFCTSLVLFTLSSLLTLLQKRLRTVNNS